ncbi:auxin-responsive protein SAUR68-like [Capsicum annuum]|nr:auxin-responsive protein SAUR68-like [Capsicum annuum]
MAMRWQKFAAMQRKRISLTRNGSDADSFSKSSPSIVRKGHFVVYTIDQTSFVIPLDYLENVVIRQLLILSEEVFGLSSACPITVLSSQFLHVAVQLLLCSKKVKTNNFLFIESCYHVL